MPSIKDNQSCITVYHSAGFAHREEQAWALVYFGAEMKSMEMRTCKALVAIMMYVFNPLDSTGQRQHYKHLDIGFLSLEHIIAGPFGISHRVLASGTNSHDKIRSTAHKLLWKMQNPTIIVYQNMLIEQQIVSEEWLIFSLQSSHEFRLFGQPAMADPITKKVQPEYYAQGCRPSSAKTSEQQTTSSMKGLASQDKRSQSAGSSHWIE